MGGHSSEGAARTFSEHLHKIYSETILELLNGGAAADLDNMFRDTPLLLLSRLEPVVTDGEQVMHGAIMKLLESGVQVESRNAKGFMPIHFAAVRGNHKLVKELADRGADVNAKGSDGGTAIGYCTKAILDLHISVHKKDLRNNLNKTKQVLRDLGALFRAHDDIPIEEDSEKLKFLIHKDGTYSLRGGDARLILNRLAHNSLLKEEEAYAFFLQIEVFLDPADALSVLRQKWNSPLTDVPALHSDAAEDELMPPPPPPPPPPPGAEDPLEQRRVQVRVAVLRLIDYAIQARDELFAEGDAPFRTQMLDLVQYVVFSPEFVESHRKIPVVLPRLAALAADQKEAAGLPPLPETLAFSRQEKDQNRRRQTQMVLSHDPEKVYEEVLETVRAAMERMDTVKEPEPTDFIADDFSMKNWSHDAWAVQITIAVHAVFCNIPKFEFMNKNFSKPEKSPYFQLLKKFNNHLSYVLLSEILRFQDENKRREIMEKFIWIADKLHDKKNYDSLVTIVSVLGNSSIFRLKRTWGKMRQETLNKWEGIKNKVGNAGRNLEREFFKKHHTQASMPNIGSVLKFMINNGEEPKYIGDDKTLINFLRYKGSAKVIGQVEHQQSIYVRDPVLPNLLEFLTKRPRYSTEKEAYDRSLELEPRAPQQ